MFVFALFATACTHDPSPDDVRRFGFLYESAQVSFVRRIWSTTSQDRRDIEVPPSPWLVYGKEVEWAEVVAYYRWRERCWDALDDMACSTYEDCRWRGCRRLKTILGVVPYYLGEMPE